MLSKWKQEWADKMFQPEEIQVSPEELMLAEYAALRERAQSFKEEIRNGQMPALPIHPNMMKTVIVTGKSTGRDDVLVIVFWDGRERSRERYQTLDAALDSTKRIPSSSILLDGVVIK